VILKRTLALLTAALVAVSGIAPPAAAAGWSWPVDGEVITTYRNGDDPYAAGQHRGIDIAAPVGTPVRAGVSGQVTFAGRLPDSGNCVTVRTNDGRYLVSYLHLGSLSVKKSDTVFASSVVGEVGLTGKRSAEHPHLHLGVRAEGVYVDPLPLLIARSVRPSPAQPSSAVVEPAAQAPAVVRSEAMHAPVKQRALHRQSRQPRHARQRIRTPDRATNPSLRTTPAHRIPTPIERVRSTTRSSSIPRVAPPPIAVERPGARLTVDGRSVARPVPVVAGSAARGGATGPRLPRVLFVVAAVACVFALFRRRRTINPAPVQSPDATVERGAAAHSAETPARPLRIVGR
jgi:murein DD-endopeptidase MepM/ murein hydrolase activator NlpD